ncbi:MAG: Xaa-Pro peptidase family protein [Desulfosarcinaceae bacterium]|nr:Xaa-Pro peptidase family protein [Desulfosarcinaceae bacterium]
MTAETPQQYTPAAELENRIQRLQRLLRAQDIDGALILQNTDLFYFAGTIQQAHLYVPAEGEALLMARKDFERARRESALKRVVPFSSPRQIGDLLRDHGLSFPKRLGMELDVLPTNLYFQYRKRFGDVTIVDVSHGIRMQRSVKTAYEVDLMRQAAALADRVAAHVPLVLAAGSSEIAVAGKLEAFARGLGHQGFVRMRLWGSELFYGHLMAGASAAEPSYLASPTGGAAVSPAVAQGPSFHSITRGQPVLVDYVFAHQGYLADHTRIYCLGKLPADLTKAQADMVAIQEEIKSMALPGTTAGAVYAKAVALADDLGHADHFMGTGAARIRFVGHGVGLELDEYPFLAKGQEMVLAENMVVALEPKVIFPGVGVVGIENTHLVTARGLEPLTRYPDEVTLV